MFDSTANQRNPTTPMKLRRCLECRNLVDRTSVCCPICGRTAAQVISAKTITWLFLLSLLIVCCTLLYRYL